MTDTNKKNHFVSLNARVELNFLPQFLLSWKSDTYSLSLHLIANCSKPKGRLDSFFLDTQMMLCLTDGFLEGLQKEDKVVPVSRVGIKWLRVGSQGVN